MVSSDFVSFCNTQYLFLFPYNHCGYKCRKNLSIDHLACWVVANAPINNNIFSEILQVGSEESKIYAGFITTS